MSANEQNTTDFDLFTLESSDGSLDEIGGSSEQDSLITPEDDIQSFSASTTAPIPVVSVPGFPGMILRQTSDEDVPPEGLPSEAEPVQYDEQWMFEEAEYEARPAPKRSKAPLIAGIAAVAVIGAVMAGAVLLHPQSGSSGARAVIPTSSASASSSSSASAAAASNAASAPSSNAAAAAEQSETSAPQETNAGNTTTQNTSTTTNNNNNADQYDAGNQASEPDAGEASSNEEASEPSGWVGWEEYYRRNGQEITEETESQSGDNGGGSESGDAGGGDAGNPDAGGDTGNADAGGSGGSEGAPE